MATTALRYLLAGHGVALLLTAGSWWSVWHCPCEPTLRTAAFWTTVTISQTVVVLGIFVLRLR
jgi:hypothetical protein